jgi:hypothetical protein
MNNDCVFWLTVLYAILLFIRIHLLEKNLLDKLNELEAATKTKIKRRQ